MERLNFDILDENHDVTALEMLSTQIGGEWSASRAKENYWTLLESEFDSGSTSHLFDTRDLTAWSQQYRDDKCTKQLYSVWIFPVNYKGIMNRHAHKIDQSTYVLTASWRDSACCFTISFECKKKKKIKSWQVCDWLAKWLIMSGYIWI